MIDDLGTPPPGLQDGQRAALAVHELSKHFGGLAVLRSVSFAVPTGTIFGIAGPNGAGKTTLLNIVTGFGVASSGRLFVGNTEATGMDARMMNHLGVARTFQNIRLFRGLTVREQVAAGHYARRQASMLSSLGCLPAERRDARAARQVADETLDFVGLSAMADRLAETLSYGDQRRLEIARALATRPTLLLLDEPTAGMNEADWQPIADLFCRLRSDGMTVVIVEHNMRLLEQACDQVAVIASGEVIAQDEPRTCLRLPVVRTAYFGK
jgi:branched-chain amino acid transport system ATP-binding protein